MTDQRKGDDKGWENLENAGLFEAPVSERLGKSSIATGNLLSSSLHLEWERYVR